VRVVAVLDHIAADVGHGRAGVDQLHEVEHRTATDSISLTLSAPGSDGAADAEVAAVSETTRARAATKVPAGRRHEVST